MVKHLYFNPKKFNQLVLSGVLIELFKSDVEVHSQDDGDEEMLRFVQGENVVEGNIINILRFANTITRRQIFGRNQKQQAVINMINGVCNDIEKKLATCVSSSQVTDKIEFLNQYWFKGSNEWIFKRGFLVCHMQILTLSFLIQQKFPQILLRYKCFVELRRLFIEQKLLSKPSLIAMFTHPENRYQEYDLFPQLEQAVSNDVRRSMGSQYGDQTQTVPYENNHQHQNEIQVVEIDEVNIINSQRGQHLNDDGDGQRIIVVEQTHPTSHGQQSQKQPSRLVEPQHIVISKLIQHQSTVVANIPSQVMSEIITTSEVQAKQQQQEANHEHHEENEQHSKAAQEHSRELFVVENGQRIAQIHQLTEQHKAGHMSQQQHEGTDQLRVNDQMNILQPQTEHSDTVENKPPVQHSNRGSMNGPKSAMNTKIRAKQQSAIVHKETCKCEIF